MLLLMKKSGKVEKLKAQDITPALGIIRIGEREDDIAYGKKCSKTM